MAVVAAAANVCPSVSSRATNTGQMAVSTSLRCPFASTLPMRQRCISSYDLASTKQPSGYHTSLFPSRLNGHFRILKAVEESQESTESETQDSHVKEAESISETSGSSAEMTELGAEIKKALGQRKEKGEDNLLSGVVEEIGEIEWPAFGNVLGTTGVVLGVIAGSSVVLLTVNAVLAELSDKVFSGKGIQDFFG